MWRAYSPPARSEHYLTHMANSHVVAYWHLVWAVKYRENVVTEPFRVPLQKIITLLFAETEQKVLDIYAMPDHTHIVLRYKYTHLLPKVINDVKSNSSRMAKELGIENFTWQPGGGAFTICPEHVEVKRRYVRRQPEHHAATKTTFVEEYRDMLLSAGLKYDGRYALVHPIEWNG